MRYDGPAGADLHYILGFAIGVGAELLESEHRKKQHQHDGK
jgi:hypothetical protein